MGSINRAIEESAIGRGVAAIRHRTGSPAFTYHTMAQLEEVFAKFDQEGTVFGSINKNSFASIQVVAPSPANIQVFDSAVQPIDDLIRNNEFEVQALTNTRDFLLPKLLSGEISVEAAEENAADGFRETYEKLPIPDSHPRLTSSPPPLSQAREGEAEISAVCGFAPAWCQTSLCAKQMPLCDQTPPRSLAREGERERKRPGGESIPDARGGRGVRVIPSGARGE